MKAINEKIKDKKKSEDPSSASAPTPVQTTPSPAPTQQAQTSAPTSTAKSPSSGVSPRVQISLAKGTIPFLQDEESKVLEFWQIWSESVPVGEEIQSGGAIEFHVSTSASMEKLTWRTGFLSFIFFSTTNHPQQTQHTTQRTKRHVSCLFLFFF